MSDLENNPLLQQENFFAGYQEKIEALKNTPEVIEFDKLTFEIFEKTDAGKRWIEIVKENYIIPGLARPGTPTYQVDVILWDGFKEFGRMILNCIKAHQQRIEAGETR